MMALKIEGTRGRYRVHDTYCKVLTRSPRRMLARKLTGWTDGGFVRSRDRYGTGVALAHQPSDLLPCRVCKASVSNESDGEVGR